VVVPSLLVGAGLDDAIGSLIEQFLTATPAAPAVCVAVDGPDGRFAVSRGLADPAVGSAMTADHAVRIASCTKTFVASTVLDVADRGLVDLDQPAIEVAPPEVSSLLAAHDHGQAITVRQLLQHRSGLVDHTETDEFAEPQRSSGRTHEWTALDQFALAARLPALFEPGAAFSYSDSGYVLLGQIIEQLNGSSLAAAVRATCRFDDLGLGSIHWERVEPTPPGLVRAHQFVDDQDTFAWNPTVDLFGGGGLVAAMPDLARWWSALFDGSVHEHLPLQIGDPQPAVGPDGTDVGVGIGLGMFLFNVDGTEFWEHSGYWGLSTFHIPALRTSVAFVVTGRVDGVMLGEFRSNVVRTLAA
jgi:D-alanyl-D-alanine carboxypeptidase